MPLPPIQIHLFRTYVRHYVASLAISVDYPVTGVVVVPTSTRDIDSYIAERETTLAQLRLPVLVGKPGYSQTVAAMAIAANIRRGMGIEPPMPPDGLTPHTRETATCEACRVIGLCDRKLQSYLELRTKLEQICGNVTKADADFCQALALRLNTYAE